MLTRTTYYRRKTKRIRDLDGNIERRSAEKKIRKDSRRGESTKAGGIEGGLIRTELQESGVKKAAQIGNRRAEAIRALNRYKIAPHREGVNANPIVHVYLKYLEKMENKFPKHEIKGWEGKVIALYGKYGGNFEEFKHRVALLFEEKTTKLDR